MSILPSNQWNPALYQGKHAFVYEHGADLIDLLSPQRGETILDLGCGTGQLTQQISDRGATVRGIDRSPEMIAEARRNYPDIAFDVADATTFEIPEPVDAVFSNAVLHWVKPPEAAVARIHAALKPGGRFVAEFGGKGNVAAIVSAANAATIDIGIATGVSNPWYFPSVGEYSSVLESRGFEMTFATLFDRPTPLEGERGFRDWLSMFGWPILASVPTDQREAFVAATESHARPTLFRNGRWIADYRRLRVVARRDLKSGGSK
jgi:trans-aconitate methyltransferase